MNSGNFMRISSIGAVRSCSPQESSISGDDTYNGTSRTHIRGNTESAGSATLLAVITTELVGEVLRVHQVVVAIRMVRG